MKTIKNKVYSLAGAAKYLGISRARVMQMRLAGIWNVPTYEVAGDRSGKDAGRLFLVVFEEDLKAFKKTRIKQDT